MRLLPAFLLLAALLAPPAAAGVVAVDPYLQVVDTSRLRLVFDLDRPEFLINVFFKDWNPQRDLAGEDGHVREFWGQTRRGVDSTGFVVHERLESHDWQVLDPAGPIVRVRIESRSQGQPPVTTTYTFVADQPWYVVERTVHFGERPDSAAAQFYAARVNFLNSYRALRWRDVDGRYLQRGYCFGGCLTSGWDGRWLEHVSLATADSFSVAQIYPDTLPPDTPIVRGAGPESFAGWVAPLLPAGRRDADFTTRLMVAFSTSAGDTAALDSLWRMFNDGVYVLDAPPAPAPPRARLAVSPNPAAGPTHVTWTLPLAARATLEVLDVGGRRVATLFAGDATAGVHTSAWSGRDAGGRALPPGVYLARLVTPGGVTSTRIVRIR